MSLASRILARAGFGTGAFATTVLLVGGLAVINDYVGLDTLFKNTQQSKVQPTLADAEDRETTEPTPDGTPAAPTPSPTPTPATINAQAVAPITPSSKRAPSGSRSVHTRSTITTKRPTTATSTVTKVSSSTTTKQVLNQINAARQAAGLSSLRMSAGLVRSAAAHNEAMASGCGLSHQCPNESGLDKRISAQGVTWTAAGENIGQGGPEPNSPNAIVSMAKQLTADMLAETAPNDGHLKNIMSKSFKHVGIDLYRDSKGMIWMTQDFSS